MDAITTLLEGSGFAGLIDKAEWTIPFGLGALEPRWKSELRFDRPIKAARELDGQERTIGDATVRDGGLVVDFAPYAPKTFAVRLAAPTARAAHGGPLSHWPAWTRLTPSWA